MRKLAFPVLAAALAAPLAAVDYVVTRYDDPAPNDCGAADCSLREAILAANASAGADRILLSAGTYNISRFGADDTGSAGDFDLTDDVEIVGAGATMTEISGQNFLPTIEEPLVEIHSAAVTLRDLMVSWAKYDGILLLGTLTLERCELFSNGLAEAEYGLQVLSGSTVVVRDTTIAGNGRGLAALGADVGLENVTVRAIDFSLIASPGAAVTCRHCTIESTGSNAAVFANGGTVELTNSIVVGECDEASGGTIGTLGGNLESPGATCGFTLGSDLDAVADPGLTAWGDHGGPTRTIDLEADSPALGLGLADDCTTDDQRGEQRRKLSIQACDSGAVERAVPPPPTPIFADGFEQGHDGAWSG